MIGSESVFIDLNVFRQRGDTMNQKVPNARQRRQCFKRWTALSLVAASMLLFPFSVYATNATESAVSSSVSSDPDADVSEITVSSNPQETLGTVSFAQANTKRIAAGKSTVLYLTIKDMGYNFATTFESSDTSVATVTMMDNRAVKVVGLKSGTVTITATVDSNSKGIKIAKYVLEIGEGTGTGIDVVSETPQSNSTASEQEGGNGGIITDFNDNDLDLFSSANDTALIQYAQQKRSGNATSLLIGLIGWAMIIMGGIYIFSVVIRSQTPKMNVSPGTRKRYSTGGSSSLRSGSRLLPNKYYRNLKKY